MGTSFLWAARGMVAILLLSQAPAWAGVVLDRIKQSNRIVIAYREASLPFSYADGSGKPQGYAIDLCLKLVDAVSKKLELKKLAIDYLLVSSATRINSVADNQADLECESTTNTVERREKVAFTVPHYITGARYLVRADSPIKELRDFEGKKLVSTAGTTPLATVRKANADRLLGIQVSEVSDHVHGIAMVESGAADGFLMDEVLLYGLIAARPDPSRFKVVGKYLTVEALGIMLSRDDADFKKVADDEMKRLIRSREAQVIYDRWFLQPIAPAGRSLNLPMNHLLRDFWKFPSDWIPN